MSRRVILSADDFGLSEAINEGIERAYREGVLNSASLMVAGAAAADAVRRAHTMPGLHVGLHVVTVEGRASLPPAEIPDLVDSDGLFPSDQFTLGLRYFFMPSARQQLAREIRAQFLAFQKTGLVLDHADAHKHMQLHPTVGGMIIDAGWEFGLPAMRVPCEPVAALRKCGERVGLGQYAMQLWSRLLRRRLREAGLRANDAVFGVTWSGRMTEQRLLRLLPNLPAGVSEIYFHPASCRDAATDRLMPGYDHVGELAALLSPAVREALSGFERTSYRHL